MKQLARVCEFIIALRLQKLELKKENKKKYKPNKRKLELVRKTFGLYIFSLSLPIHNPSRFFIQRRCGYYGKQSV